MILDSFKLLLIFFSLNTTKSMNGKFDEANISTITAKLILNKNYKKWH